MRLVRGLLVNKEPCLLAPNPTFNKNNRAQVSDVGGSPRMDLSVLKSDDPAGYKVEEAFRKKESNQY